MITTTATNTNTTSMPDQVNTSQINHHNKKASQSWKNHQQLRMALQEEEQSEESEFSSTLDLWTQLRQEALDALEYEPELCSLLHRTILAPGVESFEDAVVYTICHRLLPPYPPVLAGSGGCGESSRPVFCPNSLRAILSDAMSNDNPEYWEAGHSMATAVRRDALAVLRRDPACKTLLEVVLFYKGFAALVCHRAARQKWVQAIALQRPQRSMTALYLQSQASAVFGVDIHPATTIGAGIMFDHGTGIVIGETATIGDGCTLLHGVTLGGTGKESGDRHPKIGQNVLIGAGASILGNIRVGNGCKIGAGSVVLRPIPDGATAVGSPAKIIGRALETKPGSFMDDTLQKVAFLQKSDSATTLHTASTQGSSSLLSTASSASPTRRIRSVSVSIPDNKTTTTISPAAQSTRRFSLPPMDVVHTTNERDTSSSGDEGDNDNNNNNNNNADDDDSGDGGASSSSSSSGGSFCCPYRSYRKVRAPPTAITFGVLRKWLLPYCSDSEIGNIFFALDTRNVGYIYWHDFCQQAPAIFQKYVTSMDPQCLIAILKKEEEEGAAVTASSATTISVPRISEESLETTDPTATPSTTNTTTPSLTSTTNSLMYKFGLQLLHPSGKS